MTLRANSQRDLLWQTFFQAEIRCMSSS